MQCHIFGIPSITLHARLARSVESRRSLSGEDLGASGFGNAVRKRELEVLGEKLLDIWALDIFGLFELNDLKDLGRIVSKAL